MIRFKVIQASAFALLIVLFETINCSATGNIKELKYPWFKEEAKPPTPVSPVYPKLKDRDLVVVCVFLLILQLNLLEL